MRLSLVLALLAAPHAAGAAQSVRARLEGHVPAAAIPAVDSLVGEAARQALPAEPLVQKALEGGAKHVSAERIVKAVQVSLAQLREAHNLLVHAGDTPPASAAEVATVSAALKRRVPALVIERVVQALPGEPRGPALHAVADLVAHGFQPDASAGLILAAAHQGLRGERMLDVATAALHEVQRGHTPAEALARVREQLPDVPAAPTPARATVLRARRPGPPLPQRQRLSAQ